MFYLDDLPEEEWLLMKRYYKCTYICHRCDMDKDNYMVESPLCLLQQPRITNMESFISKCLKPGDVRHLSLLTQAF